MHARLWILVSLLLGHTALVAWSASANSPTYDETAHLAAGISHWHTGRFSLYCVNPPLVRLIGSLPVLAAAPQVDWSEFRTGAGERREFAVQHDFIASNGSRTFLLVTLARWACIPFTILGATICFVWARELYGKDAAFVAALLWCCSPTILAYAPLIVTDAAAAALGVAAMFSFRCWLTQASWDRALVAGLVLGLAQLSKTTWIVLFAFYPVLWLVWRFPVNRSVWPQLRRQAAQLTALLTLAIVFLNLGYGFEGSFTRLGDYEFVTHALGRARNSTPYDILAGNRFRDTVLAKLPVPFPKPYVEGLDLQKWDFERRLWSYLRGEWRHGGWLHYYLYALAVKVPVGSWLLVAIAAYASIRDPKYAAGWREELTLGLPAIIILGLVSSQTGFNHHVRYVLPTLPFGFVWVSKAARSFGTKHCARSIVVVIALACSVSSSLFSFPHNLSYFNEFVGGPKRGHLHLANSNIDWGQDLFFFKSWLQRHPEAHEIAIAYHPDGFDLAVAGFQSPPPPQGRAVIASFGVLDEKLGPRPGWYALSINRICERTGGFAYFLNFEPVAKAGYSIYIYHITLPEANRVRNDLGLTLLNEDDREERVP